MKRFDYNSALEVIGKTLNSGGYSFNEYSDGYMVSLEGTERKICLHGNTVIGVIYKIIEFFVTHKTVNTWLDNKILYLDVSVNVANLDEALELAKENKQLAIYDCKAGKVIEL